MKQYKSMRGVSIDLAKLMAKSEKNISVGNTSTNARGDQLGRGGRVVKSADAIAREHYNVNNPRAVVKSSIKVDNDVDMSGKDQAVVQEAPAKKQTEDDWKEPVSTPVEEPKEEVKETAPVTEEAVEDDWVEDDEGNFVKASEIKKTTKKTSKKK